MDTKYLDRFENQLQDELLRLCASYKMLDNNMLKTEDVEEHWHQLAPEYMVDAVREIQNYPLVSVSWAAYIGMAIAYAWDKDWEEYQKKPYSSYYGSRGFDDMDEHILQDVLGLSLESKEADEINEMIYRCGEATVSIIRHAGVEPQSPLAFHVFARAVRTMYRIGAALELYRLGYKLEKVDLPNQLFS